MWYVFVFHLTFLVIIKQHRSRVHFHVMQQWRKNYFHVGRRGRDRMVVIFTTICAISAYHH